MMPESPTPDEFDHDVRRALADVAAATNAEAGLADRLVVNARAGRPALVGLAARRRAKRWAMPLLAAAAVAVLALGGALVAHSLADGDHAPVLHHVPPQPSVSSSMAPSVASSATSLPTTSPATSSAGSSAPAPPPQSAPVAHFRAVDVYFADARDGWALGDGRCASSARTDCPALLATADGGASWRSLTVPTGLVSTFDSASCGTNGDLSGPCVDAVLFADASNGYLWSLHEIYWTTDGGSTWSRYIDPAHDWDGAAAMVVGDGRVVRVAPVQQCSSGCPGAVESAPVGTVDWQITKPATGQVGLYSSALFSRAGDVYLFAGGDYANTSAGVFRSVDGGASWSRLAHDVCGPSSDPQQDPFWAANSLAADDGTLVANCFDSMRVAPAGSARFTGAGAFPHVQQFELEAAASAQQIVGADTSRSYATTPAATTFYVTADGGRTWNRTVTLPVRQVRFATGTNGYAISADGSRVYATSDGGRTWRELVFGG